ncbi:MAG: fumarate hydratase [Syntrophales bacterium]|jgi:fumarate hydratase subunit alpha|nr:fumarate hydratase [Syntrophales bacterium]MDY0044441.1 fumarate hydratase [Syntrophales bacterium]
MRLAMGAVRDVDVVIIADKVRELFIEASKSLGEDVVCALEKARTGEYSELGRFALDKIIENIEIAKDEALPLCQDTGIAVLFVRLGQDVHLTGGNLEDAVQKGVREAYREGYLRKSVCDPLSRTNTGDNTPAVIHIEIVEGDRVQLIAMPKGGGSENMSSVKMLTPSEGLEGIKRHVIETVRQAGPNPCPPIIVGVGIGGTMEISALLAKKALARQLDLPNQADPRLSQLEKELKKEINNLGIGPQGYGGAVTALAVHAEMMPCHIASLPVAINIQCHVARHRETVI